MRVVAMALLLCLLGASRVAAQDVDGATWILRAREAIAAARYDTARTDLERAARAPATPGLEREIAATRETLLRAETVRAGASEPHAGWTHGVSMGLFGGAAFAAGSSIGFGLAAAIGGFGKPPCGSDCTRGFEPDLDFGLSVASGISVLALVSVAAWLAIDGRSLESSSSLVPLVAASGDGLWLGVSGLL